MDCGNWGLGCCNDQIGKATGATLRDLALVCLIIMMIKFFQEVTSHSSFQVNVWGLNVQSSGSWWWGYLSRAFSSDIKFLIFYRMSEIKKVTKSSGKQPLEAAVIEAAKPQVKTKADNTDKRSLKECLQSPPKIIVKKPKKKSNAKTLVLQPVVVDEEDKNEDSVHATYVEPGKVKDSELVTQPEAIAAFHSELDKLQAISNAKAAKKKLKQAAEAKKVVMPQIKPIVKQKFAEKSPDKMLIHKSPVIQKVLLPESKRLKIANKSSQESKLSNIPKPQSKKSSQSVNVSDVSDDTDDDKIPEPNNKDWGTLEKVWWHKVIGKAPNQKVQGKIKWKHDKELDKTIYSLDEMNKTGGKWTKKYLNKFIAEAIRKENAMPKGKNKPMGAVNDGSNQCQQPLDQYITGFFQKERKFTAQQILDGINLGIALFHSGKQPQIQNDCVIHNMNNYLEYDYWESRQQFMAILAMKKKAKTALLNQKKAETGVLLDELSTFVHKDGHFWKLKKVLEVRLDVIKLNIENPLFFLDVLHQTGHSRVMIDVQIKHDKQHTDYHAITLNRDNYGRWSKIDCNETEIQYFQGKYRSNKGFKAAEYFAKAQYIRAMILVKQEMTPDEYKNELITYRRKFQGLPPGKRGRPKRDSLALLDNAIRNKQQSQMNENEFEGKISDDYQRVFNTEEREIADSTDDLEAFFKRDPIVKNVDKKIAQPKNDNDVEMQ